MKIIYVEPYLGFSHLHWIEGYQKYSSHQVEIVGLPARFWKWRMLGGAISLGEMLQGAQECDLLLVSAMIDLPLFKALIPDNLKKTPIALYFHENQFAYPSSLHEGETKDEHYGFINFKSALVADKVYFNSGYNRESFLEGAKELIKKMPDFSENSWIKKIESKAEVLPLGMEFLGNKTQAKTSDLPLILWNHRWEYDKNPDLFFQTLFRLKEAKIPFSLAVLGESFRTTPAIFEEAKLRLDGEIKFWGFQEREVYEKILGSASVLPVTSNQDFFGISVLEAAEMGVVPLLPKRLAYPEHFKEDYFYDSEEDFYEKLKARLLDPRQLDAASMEKIRGYSWEFMAPVYDEEFLKFLN